MTRVLWVCTEPPDRDLGGGSIRQSYLLEALARQVETHLISAHEVRDPIIRDVVASLREYPDPKRAFTGEPPRERDPEYIPRRRSALSLFLRRVRAAPRVLLKPDAMEISGHAEPRARLVPHLADHERYDIVQVEHAWLTPLLPATRRNRWLLTMHNLPSERGLHAVDITESTAHRLVVQVDRWKARRMERQAVRDWDNVFVTSDEDAAALPRGVTVIPNGVDVAKFVPTPVPTEHTIVLTASLNYRPNIEGALWFVDEVLPLVRRDVPDVRLTIAGRDPDQDIASLAADPAVTVVANPPSMVPVIAGARVAVVPIRIGSGTRLKALEAMASGRPVVGTTIGLAGLGIVSGRHAVVADDPAGTARAVVQLLQDHDLAQRLAAEGRALVETRFDWGRIGAQYVAAVLRS